MLERIILLSGPISSGKSTLAGQLAERFKLSVVTSRDLIIEGMKDEPSPDRQALQKRGNELDRRTKGEWVADELSRRHDDFESFVVVDCVRTQAQIDAIRRAFGRRVVHIHLEAPEELLRSRYEQRKRTDPPYRLAIGDETESRVVGLGSDADIVIDTRRCSREDVVVRAASRLGLYGQTRRRLVDVLVGGQYGSEGKGNIAAYLAPEYEWLVRVGGPNAGHKVARDTGDVFTHHHLPSGTRTSEARLLLGPGAVLNVLGLLQEIAESAIDYERLAIDPQAMIISEDDVKAETGLVQSIGSTGQGVGAATARRIMEREASSKNLARDVLQLRPYLRSAREVLEDAFSKGQRVFLEGTQGTALSLLHGSYPHVTSRDTTAIGCLADAGIAPNRVRKVIMVCRTYPIRVQSPKGSTSGAISQEITWQEVAKRSGLPYRSLLNTEKTSTTGRRRRVGEFDWALLRRAAQLNGPTDVALTFADYLDKKNQEARRFEQLSDETIRFVEEIERVAGAPVTLISTRFHYRSVIDRRSW